MMWERSSTSTTFRRGIRTLTLRERHMSTTRDQKANEPLLTASRSSDSVKVTYLDAKAVRQEIRRAVHALARPRPEVKRVLLFGSLATGQAVPGSDGDLLVILHDCALPFLDRIPLYTPVGCSVGLDVFPYTEREMESMQSAGNWLIKRAFAEGIEIYQAEGRSSTML